MQKKPFWNRVINALSLIAFCLMVSTGTVMKWILPPGSGRAGGRFAGHDGQGPRLLLGLNRHEWGDIHFYISIVFLVLLALHLVLHWNWICVTAWGTKQCPQSWRRKAATILIVGSILAALILPWVLAAGI